MPLELGRAPYRPAAGGFASAAHVPRLETLTARAVEPASTKAAPAAGPTAHASSSIGAPTDGSPALGRAAARVPGGRAALATPLASSALGEEPWGAAVAAAALLPAALALAALPGDGADEPRSGGAERGSPRAVLVTRDPPGPPGREPASGAAVSPFLLPGHGDAALGARERHDGDDLPPAVTSRSGRALEQLLRRWEGATPVAAPDLASGRARREDDAPAVLDVDLALARALERLLAAELRRSGIALEAE
jgi:hypothetical protein